MKTCVKCKHHKVRYDQCDNEDHFCTHPSVVEHDLVTGDPIYPKCRQLRSPFKSRCGPKGELWEPNRPHRLIVRLTAY